MRWCEQEMINLNIPTPVETQMFFRQYPSVAYIIPPWYEQLVERGREYNHPDGKLTVLPSPLGGYNWEPHTEVTRAINREFDDVIPGEFEGSSEEEGDSLLSSSENEPEE